MENKDGINIQVPECQAEAVGLNLGDNQHTIALLFLYLNESSNNSSCSTISQTTSVIDCWNRNLQRAHKLLESQFTNKGG